MIKTARIYYCDDYDFECESFLKLLPRGRFEKYHRLQTEKDKKNCVGVYLLLCKALKEAGVEDFKIVTTETGKPYLEGSPLHISLSHSKKGFACAVDSGEIGVDIQEIVCPKPATLEKACTVAERTVAGNDDSAFTKLWTYKESIIKKRGETLSRYKDYSFSSVDDDFFSYGCHFVSRKDAENIITVCGEFSEYEFIKVKSTEF